MIARHEADEIGDPIGYLRRFFPCPHWTTVEAHPSFCATCGGSNQPGETCPIRLACDTVERRLATSEQERDEAREDADRLASVIEYSAGPVQFSADEVLRLHAAALAQRSDPT